MAVDASKAGMAHDHDGAMAELMAKLEKAERNSRLNAAAAAAASSGGNGESRDEEDDKWKTDDDKWETYGDKWTLLTSMSTKMNGEHDSRSSTYYVTWRPEGDQ